MFSFKSPHPRNDSYSPLKKTKKKITPPFRAVLFLDVLLGPHLHSPSSSKISVWIIYLPSNKHVRCIYFIVISHFSTLLFCSSHQKSGTPRSVQRLDRVQEFKPLSADVIPERILHEKFTDSSIIHSIVVATPLLTLPSSCACVPHKRITIIRHEECNVTMIWTPISRHQGC